MVEVLTPACNEHVAIHASNAMMRFQNDVHKSAPGMVKLCSLQTMDGLYFALPSQMFFVCPIESSIRLTDE
jgi:hypothetical protein